jgi:Cdc6-like AAA superfamily ATPase
MARWGFLGSKQTRADPGHGLSITPVVPLRDAFTPTRPQRGSTAFVGRRKELRRILEVLEDEQAHIVLYGDRGLGKTSLMNRATGMLRAAGYCVGRHICDTNSDFESIMRGLIRDIPESFLVVPVSDQPGARGCEQALPQREIEPGDIASLPSRLNAPHVVLIADEFDRVRSHEVQDRLADTIKQVSDRAVALSFVIIGVSGDLEELIGRYPSIRRSIVGIQLPALTNAETARIITDAAEASGFVFPPAVTFRIVSIAAGSPYLTHLLGLRATQAARARDSHQVTESDLDIAIRRVSEEVHPEVLLQHSQPMSALAASARERPAQTTAASQFVD